jgi:hypothetical protein
VSEEQLLVRSYRPVFRLERRIYRVDRFLLPVPGGIPLRGLVYFLVALLLVLVAGALPAVGSLLDVAAPPVRYGLLPAAVAVLGTHASPDGRAPHRFVLTWLAYRLRPRRRAAGRTVPLEGQWLLLRGEIAVEPREPSA